MLTYVPAHVAAPVIRKLVEDGYLPSYIEEATGVPAEVLWRLVDGRQSKILTCKFRDILRVRLGESPGDLVDATGVRRRLQSLQFECWHPRTIAAACGVSEGTQRRILRGPCLVKAETAWAIDELYRESVGLGCPWPDPEIGKRAEAQGWVLGSSWDDIDDPDAAPDEEADEAVRWSR